jgi:hypothetical protein
MSYYKKLNLPTHPFKDWEAFIEEKLQGPRTRQEFFDVLSIDQYITEELRDILQQHNIQLKHLIVFCAGNNVAAANKRIIHSDIYWDQASRSWKDIHCGINWELDGSNLFSWWDMQALTKQYPMMTRTLAGLEPHSMYGTDRNHILNGLHYGNKRAMKGAPAGAVQLDQTYIDGPTLVRTDVPHMTVYNSPRRRFGISLRIDESNVNSWDEVLELFKPLIKE